MSSPQDWCAEQLSKLLHEELRISTLNEIKDHFATLTQNEALATANCLQLPLVFDCLNDTDTNQVDLACEVLSLCMNSLTIGETTNKYCTHLERALKHPYAEVKIMSLKELERYTENEDLLLDLCRRLSVVHTVIECIGDDDLEVAKKASLIVIKMSLIPLGIKQLVKPETSNVLQQVMSKNEMVQLRVYEVLIDSSKQSEDSFIAFQTIGLIQKVIDDLNNNDVLLKLNIIEILSGLAVTNHGFKYLESQNVFTNLFKYFLPGADPLDLQICEPGILKFFAHIAHWKPVEVFMKYPHAVEKMFKNIESDDLTLYTVSLDILGHIGSNNEGKLALEVQNQKFEKSIRQIVGRFSSSPTEAKISAFNCLAKLLSSNGLDSNLEKLTHKWFNILGNDPMDFIVKYCKNPFMELRLGGFAMLQAMAGQLWGQELIKTTPGLVEFLMDRSAEVIKECKEAKYTIVTLLAKSSVFDNAMQSRLRKFVNEGPFYQQGTVEVATEGND